MGLLFQNQGKLDVAESLLREALEGRRRVVGNEHPATLVSMNNLAGLLQEQGRLDDAELLYREAWKTSRLALGGTHPDSSRFLANLIALLKTKRKQ